MELSTNISMAALAEVCRLVDTTQKRRIVDQYLVVIQYLRKVVTSALKEKFDLMGKGKNPFVSH